MKKKLALIIVAFMTVSVMSVNVSAEEYPEVSVLVEGEKLECDQPAVIIDNRTMVPVRAIGEVLDVSVDWIAETKTVVYEKDDIKATLAIGANVLNITDGDVTVPVEIDTPAVIVNGRTLVPIRFISENFRADVDWDNETKTVNITRKSDVTTLPGLSDDLDPVSYAKKLAIIGDTTIEFLSNYEHSMTEEQIAVCNESSDVIATSLQVLDTQETFSEEEINAITAELNDAFAGLTAVTEELDLLGERLTYLFVAEVSDIANTLDLTIGCLNDCTDKMTDEQSEAFSKYCDVVATALQVLDTQETFTYAEVEAIAESLTEVGDGLDKLVAELDLVDEVNAHLQAENDANDLADVTYELLDRVTEMSKTLAEVEMNEEQAEIYKNFNVSMEEVNNSTADLSSADDFNNAIDILTSVQKGFTNLAEELGVELN